LLTLSAHTVERSPFAPVILIACNARAQPWAWRDGHRAHQKVCMPCRAVLQAARSAHAERSLLFNACNLRAPHILLRCVSCSLAACAQSSVQTQHRVCPCMRGTSFKERRKARARVVRQVCDRLHPAIASSRASSTPRCGSRRAHDQAMTKRLLCTPRRGPSCSAQRSAGCSTVPWRARCPSEWRSFAALNAAGLVVVR
jgi:hypothetical protein